ncbi:hypothetical protein D9758_004292 [Tetrapyrgos nigripes]|uniref:Uncharacterized protein n=1 Tax=Tetrapyrgos nigripes TaxID=182062 RepID=A0A8H5GUD4_9AGAR|nr:hypothetical protein D9758_004292 [Tetrapyrgos nigripes]
MVASHSLFLGYLSLLPLLTSAFTPIQNPFVDGDPDNGWKFLPTVPDADLHRNWTISGTNATFPVYQSSGLDNSAVTRAVIVPGGKARDAWSYWIIIRNILSYAAEADPASVNASTISILSPFFLAGVDVQAGGGTATELYWSKSGWFSGTYAQGPNPDDKISSFHVLDEVVNHYADKERYPNLQEIIFIGHSAGAQLYQRYAALRVPTKHDDIVHYIPANPGSFLWLVEDRPAPNATCPDVDRYKYGLNGGFPGYSTGDAKELGREGIIARYRSRNVHYAQGTTAPFLIRTFIKIGAFHRLSLFEDGTLPTTDEQQIFTWKDATLREVLTTIRNTSPTTPEYRHPLARFSFRTVYADPGNKGRFAQKELGIIYSRDILGEPGSLEHTAPRLLEDEDDFNFKKQAEGGREPTEREREERTLDELRFVPGDYLCVAVLLPKNVTVPSELSIRGSGSGSGANAGPPSNGWRSGPVSAGPSGTVGSGRGIGSGHWRGGSDGPLSSGAGRGRGGRGGRDRGDSFDRDRRVPPPRRGDGSPPSRGGWGRGGGGGRQTSRSRSRSRTPPRRRGSRYD